METKIQKWGNSQGLRIAKNILKESGISIGDEVNLTVRGGKIVVALKKPARRKQSLQELVSRIPEGYKTKEESWGKPAGREVW
jgi:antitoxin MazE